MAYLVHPQVEFRPTAVSHSPSPLGFGFGLASSGCWQPQGMLSSNYSPTHQISTLQPTQSPQKYSQKRRHEDADDDRDESMDRSPTPEHRPIRRIIPKRSRLALDDYAGNSSTGKENKQPNGESNDSVDVGMLLASLPAESLLPILNSLLTTMPSIKPTILSLIPRPTLQTALTAINQAAKKLRDAYPYSASQSTLPPIPAASFGFGSHFGASRANMLTPSSSNTAFPRPSPSSQPSMRDSYVVSRLRPHINEFISTALSYIPYFSYITSDASQKVPGQSSQGPKDKAMSHPTETFEFLSVLTNHLLSQPALAQASLLPQILPRLLQEWMAWVDRVDSYVNKEAGMFGLETAQSWVRALDQFAVTQMRGVDSTQEAGLRNVRDKWVSRVGWLVGRREAQSMDDEEEEEL